MLKKSQLVKRKKVSTTISWAMAQLLLPLRVERGGDKARYLYVLLLASYTMATGR
jgi:hypothetical protein